MSLNIPRTRELLQDFDFEKLFVEELGWSAVASGTRHQSEEISGAFIERRQIAQLSGVVVLELKSLQGAIPDAKARAAIHHHVSQQHHENLLIFTDKDRTQSLWYWVKREEAKRYPREHLYVKGQPGDLFLSKLSALVVEISELDAKGNIAVVEVANRLRAALDVEKITKRFYQEFQQEHLAFLELIRGIGDDRDRRWYASILLNRLMFIYFLQRKGFLNNGDTIYLQNKLKQGRESGRDRYYRYFLKTLFFEGFAKPEKARTTQARELLGKIHYLNGGLFLIHRIEQEWTEIQVPDKAFENLFRLFERYSWNLNDTPGGEDDEINPDVLGYIFEKYINQKAFGAYYTRTEITEYLCERTIHKLILDRIHPVIEPRKFDSMDELLMNLDARLCRELVGKVLPEISILDPACGSGAFLVAALKTLIKIYSAVIGRIHFLGDSYLKKWLKDIERDHQSVAYFVKKKIVTDNLFGVDLMEEACEIAKLRLFLAMVASIQSVDDLEPLPNIDFNILAGNSLIGLMNVDAHEFEEAFHGDMFRKSYRQILDEKNRLIENYRHTAVYSDDLRMLREKIDQIKAEALPVLNELLYAEFQKLGIKFEEATWDDAENREGKPKKRALKMEDIEALHPFHWGYEFDEIVHRRGGFDIIITNPPWEIFKPQAKEFFSEYSAIVTKNKMTIKDFEKEQAKLLKNSEVRTAWLEYQSRFPHLSLYYRSALQYKNQISIVNGKKAGTDINLYKLFLEQCFNLLGKHGDTGIVIPSGIYTDLGTKQLRELLFEQNMITGLYGFENRKAIFEGVHRSYKFIILTFQKGGPTTSFPTAFMRHNVEELDRFPREGALTLSVDLIQRLSPGSLSIMEFKDEMDIRIAEKMLQFPPLGEKLDGTWNLEFSREFDMNTDSDLFKPTTGTASLPLVQGGMFHQYQHSFAEPKYWLNEKLARARLLGKIQDARQILPYQSYRLIHRRIARNTDQRTLISCVLPPGRFCADTAQTVTGLDWNITIFVVGIFNSFVTDFELRQRVTAHADMHFMYNLHVPRLNGHDLGFRAIVERTARLICTTREFDELAREVGLGSHKSGVTDPKERAKLRAELDGMIAHLYGLTEEEFVHILGTFPIVEASVKDAALEAYRAFAPKTPDQEIVALLEAGESHTLEFKAAARWDIHQNKTNKQIEQAIVKTVAAFLNSDGGTLLIGVDDSGKVVGLENDFKTLGKKQNPDGFENFLITLLTEPCGKDIASLLRVTFHNVDGFDVCRVTVRASPKPVFVKEGTDEHLYVRAGNSTRLLTTREAIEHCKMHWPPESMGAQPGPSHDAILSRPGFAFAPAGRTATWANIRLTNHGELAKELEAILPEGVRSRFHPSNVFGKGAEGMLILESKEERITLSMPMTLRYTNQENQRIESKCLIDFDDPYVVKILEENILNR